MRTATLTPMEQSLLAFLTAHPNQIITRQELLRQVWGTEATQHTRTVDMHVAALRHKCGLEQQLLTVYKLGYLFREE